MNEEGNLKIHMTNEIKLNIMQKEMRTLFSKKRNTNIKIVMYFCKYKKIN